MNGGSSYVRGQKGRAGLFRRSGHIAIIIPWLKEHYNNCEDIAAFAAGGDYKQSDATGFISIYGLPTKVQAIVNNEKEGL